MTDQNPPDNVIRMESQLVRTRFRQAADLALEYLSNRSLDYWAWRIESELRCMVQHDGKSMFDMSPAESRKAIIDLLGESPPST